MAKERLGSILFIIGYLINFNEEMSRTPLFYPLRSCMTTLLLMGQRSLMRTAVQLAEEAALCEASSSMKTVAILLHFKQ